VVVDKAATTKAAEEVMAKAAVVMKIANQEAATVRTTVG
jgi:hypothetical protein